VFALVQWTIVFGLWTVLDIAYICVQNLMTVASAAAHQNLNGSRDLIKPLSGMICHLWDYITLELFRVA